MKKVLAKGSKLLTLTIEGMIARGVIQTDMHKSKVPHETTFLYERSAAILQALADRTRQKVVEQFGTVHPTMKLWMKHKGRELHFVITDNENDGRTLKAEREFMPRISKE